MKTPVYGIYVRNVFRFSRILVKKLTVNQILTEVKTFSVDVEIDKIYKHK